MKKLILLLLCASSGSVHAQDARDDAAQYDEARWKRIITTVTPAGAGVSSGLHQLATLAVEDRAEAVVRLHRSEYRYRASDDRVNIEIVLRHDENLERITDRISGEYMRSLGFEVDATWKNRASIWIPLEDILAKRALLPAEYFMRHVLLPRGDNQGPAIMNSAGYNAGSAPGGAGKKIAVFDGGFLSMQTAINNGHMKTPASVRIGNVATTLGSVNSGAHGTGVAETVYDNCPDADIYLFANGNITDKGNAVDWCITEGVDVIVMSQSEYNEGWADNTGAACAYAQDAANNGILFVTSCGNRAESHYEATFTDADGDNRHEFSGTDEGNNLNSAVPANDGTHAVLSWNTSVSADYDLYIIRTSDGDTLASSTNTGTSASAFEYAWFNTGGSSVNVYFRVVRRSGSATQFEMFTHNAGTYQHATAAGSNTSPSNTTDPNVISVGAVERWNYEDTSGATGLIVGYSSRGPTNSGNLAPKITGPTETDTWIYGGGFGGTSCAAPNVAGAITAFWSANAALDATGVRQIVNRKAHLYMDWGTAGQDNVYGHGGLFLFPYASNLRYMYRTSTNAAVTNSTRPFYNLAVAEQQAPHNSTVIILNSGAYPETGLYGVAGNGANKRIMYRSPFIGVNPQFGY